MSDNTNSIELSIGNITLSVSGSAEFVKEHYHELSEKHGFDDIDVSDVDVKTSSTMESANGEDGEEVSEATVEKALNEILRDADISLQKDKALVVGWYLEYARGKDDFIRDEVVEEARRSKVTLGENVGRDLGYKVEDGHLAPGEERDGDDTFWVTQTGLDYLEENGIPAR